MDISREKGFQRAARLLMLLGREEAAKVLQHLSEKEVEGIVREIASTEKLDVREAARVLEEFGWHDRAGGAGGGGREVAGGPEQARRILVEAMGSAQAEAILKRVLEKASPPFAFLEDLDVEQVRLLIEDESVPIIATILVHLPPARAAKVLTVLPAETQKELVRRVAALKRLDPEVIRRTEEALREKVRAQGRIVTRELDGRNALAEILQHMSVTDEREILDRLQQADRELAREVEDRVYSPRVLLEMNDRELQEVLKEFSEPELALVLKGLDPLQKEKILSNVSTNRREMINTELAALGPVRRSKVLKAQRELMDYIRLQEERGNVRLARREETLNM